MEGRATNQEALVVEKEKPFVDYGLWLVARRRFRRRGAPGWDVGCVKDTSPLPLRLAVGALAAG
ncbi:TPA: hypothetical protein DEA21_01910 [Candidatus Uhrbacteria bacterium]|nr:hypothetical protein [Candidatus Uhrbacteria bacterium]HCU31896.1 hypothetical protein [Candidatus Uhrbacteria bacterium]